MAVAHTRYARTIWETKVSTVEITAGQAEDKEEAEATAPTTFRGGGKPVADVAHLRHSWSCHSFNAEGKLMGRATGQGNTTVSREGHNSSC